MRPCRLVLLLLAVSFVTAAACELAHAPRRRTRQPRLPQRPQPWGIPLSPERARGTDLRFEGGGREDLGGRGAQRGQQTPIRGGLIYLG